MNSELMSYPNVIGFGKGIVRRAGVDYPEHEAVVVLVSRKLPIAAFADNKVCALPIRRGKRASSYDYIERIRLR